MEHVGTPLLNQNIRCSCGQVFSTKGFPIHVGMKGPKKRLTPLQQRAKDLKEARALEEEIGWPKGTLSDPEAWPPIYKPLTKAQIAKRRQEETERQAARAKQVAADEREWHERVADVLLDLAKETLGITTDRNELGILILQRLSDHWPNININEYNDYVTPPENW